jgi:predicted SnoaL-like aldol condensation-catalyzing enzyme
MSALIVAAPPGYLKLIAPLPEGVSVSHVANGTHPFVQFFATHASEVKKSAPKFLKHATPGALVWIAYPKQTSGVASDLSREAVRDAMHGAGWRAVSIVAIDEVWSALRFRPTKDVKSRK